MNTNERDYSLWVVVRPAADVPGQWVAHCLDLDLVTQGNSLVHAIEMAHESANAIILDDLNADEDPLERRAPKRYWDEMWKELFPKSHRVNVTKLAEHERCVEFALVCLTLGFKRVRPDSQPRASSFATSIAFSHCSEPHCTT